MLVLSRKVGESILVGDDIEVVITEVRGEIVRVGINAPKAVRIMRRELVENVAQQNRAAAKVPSVIELPKPGSVK